MSSRNLMVFVAVLVLTLAGSTGIAVAYDLNGEYDFEGPVGIGTASPVAKLHVESGGGPYEVLKLSAAYPTVYLDTFGGNDWALLGNPAFLGVRDVTGGAYRLYINTAGNVGIGTESPTAKLHVNSGGNWNEVFKLSAAYPSVLLDSGGNDWALIGNPSYTGIYDVTGGAYRLYINTAGNVGIGTESPTAKLDVDGDIVADNVNVTGVVQATDVYVELEGNMVSLVDLVELAKEGLAIQDLQSRVAAIEAALSKPGASGISRIQLVP